MEILILGTLKIICLVNIYFYF